jgi:two-component SAPR family response regulator
VPVTPKACDLLAALIEQPERLISKEELLQKVWPDTFVEEANLAHNVFALRKALGDTAANGQYIETIAKKGVPVHCHDDARDTGEWRIAIAGRCRRGAGARSSRCRGVSRERQTAPATSDGGC